MFKAKIGRYRCEYEHVVNDLFELVIKWGLFGRKPFEVTTIEYLLAMTNEEIKSKYVDAIHKIEMDKILKRRKSEVISYRRKSWKQFIKRDKEAQKR